MLLLSLFNLFSRIQKEIILLNSLYIFIKNYIYQKSAYNKYILIIKIFDHHIY